MTDSRQENPLDQGPKPPFPAQEQAPPGLESEMDPRPDYGAETYRGTGKLREKAAVVTGGDSGIGRAVALAFAREGADVLVSYLSEHADAQETVRAVEEAGRKGMAVAGDIGDEAHCGAIVERAIENFGRLDVLVNNAAFQQAHDSITEIPSAAIEYVFRTNVLSYFWFCKAAIPHMRPGSAIVNTASVQAYEPSPSVLHYAHDARRDRDVHEGARAGADQERDPRQRSRPRARLDAADRDVVPAGRRRALRRG